MANIICCTTTEAHTSQRCVGLCCSLSLSLPDGNGKGTPINTLPNSARAKLHLFSILHGRIKFYLPPHGKVRDENSKVREAAKNLWYCKKVIKSKRSILVPPLGLGSVVNVRNPTQHPIQPVVPE
ncbi:hypothetical protein AVEN_1597-1 [Araneus ventricosus]|uniref:Uncharacterized protein n=1 Tax=Araneus ventricosus TaxID=182803 RepID=A0A4Y2DQE9_ARAVE|nr:hypothetical protein AVEN_1597-1 [Araneus ventricosus]